MSLGREGKIFVNEVFELIKMRETDKVISLLNTQPISINYSNPSYNGWSLIHIACSVDAVDIVRFLLKQKKLNVNKISQPRGNTCLHVACANGAEKCVEQLLKQKHLDINRCNSYGNTPVYFAAKYGFEKIVKALVEAGAKKDIKNCMGNTSRDVSKNERIRRLLEGVLQEKENTKYFIHLLKENLFTNICITLQFPKDDGLKINENKKEDVNDDFGENDDESDDESDVDDDEEEFSLRKRIKKREKKGKKIEKKKKKIEIESNSEIYCHKVILNQSKYLKSKIEKGENLFEKFENRKFVLYCIYWLYGVSHEMDLNEEDLYKIYVIGKRWVLPDLCKFICTKVMSINPINVIPLIQKVDISSAFYLHCLKLIQKNQKVILTNENMKTIKNNQILLDIARVSYMNVDDLISKHDDFKDSVMILSSPGVLLKNYISSLLSFECVKNKIVLISNEDTQYYVHECVVGRYEYFRNKFLNKKCFEIKMEDINDKYLRIMVKYFYTQNLEIENKPKIIMKFSKIASKYKLFILERTCIEKIKSLVDDHNVFEIMELTHEIIHDEKELKNKVISFLKKQTCEDILNEFVKVKNENRNLKLQLFSIINK